MEAYRTDEEQVEALKKWWKENGVSIVISVLLAVSAVFGWKAWQQNQQITLEAGSYAYQKLLEAVYAAESEPDDIKIATVDHLAQSLKDKHSGAAYAHFAAFFKAQQAVKDDDLSLAESELRWVLANDPVREVQLTAELRLAKVLFAQGNVSKALEILDRGTEASAFAPAFLEAKGDILLSQGDYQQAVEAYTQSQKKVESLKMPNLQVLVSKLAYAKSYL